MGSEAKAVCIVVACILAFICGITLINYNDNQNIRMAQIEAVKAGATIAESRCLYKAEDYGSACRDSILIAAAKTKD